MPTLHHNQYSEVNNLANQQIKLNPLVISILLNI